MKRRVKLEALILIPAVLLAGLAGLASNKVNARLDEAAVLEMTKPELRSTDTGTSSAYRSGRLLLPLALERARRSGQGHLSKEAQIRLLDDLQARVGVYRPWAKVPSQDSLRLDRAQ